MKFKKNQTLKTNYYVIVDNLCRFFFYKFTLMLFRKTTFFQLVQLNTRLFFIFITQYKLKYYVCKSILSFTIKTHK